MPSNTFLSLLESKRKEAVEAVLEKEVEYHSSFDLAVLTSPNRETARILTEAGHYITELYMMQNHPEAILFRDRLIASGDAASLKFMKRMLSPLSRYGGPYANAVKTFPDDMTGLIMWPAGVSKEMLTQMRTSAQPENDTVLSPFTVVKKGDQQKIVAMSAVDYPPFSTLMKKISEKLSEASKVSGIDPSFAHQLALQSEAFKSHSAYPYFESDEAWTKSAGQLELIIGPYETARDPFETKAFFEFVLAAEDPKATTFLEEMKKLLPEIERGIAGNSLTGVYQPRNVTQTPKIRVVNALLATGLAAGDEGPHLATILPNVGPMSDENERKTVVFANHHEAKLPLLKKIADVTLVPVMAEMVDANAFTKFSLIRTLMNELGPKGGASSTAKQNKELIGEFFNSLTQAKTGAAAVWTARFLAEKGVITTDELKQIYATYIANLFRYMALGLKTPHGEGAAAEFSYLVSNQAIKKNGYRLEVDMERFHSVVCSYLGEVVDAIAMGNAAKSEELLYGYTVRAADYLVEVINRIEKANTPSDVAIYYHVEGL